MPSDSRIPRKNLHDELAGLIRNMIIERELIPGKRIREQALCTRFGVSRTPLREALKVLSVEGLVQLLPNRGAIVVRITPDQADDVIGLLGLLEAFASDRICGHINDAGIAAIRALHEHMVEHLERDEKQPCIALDRAIRRAMIEAAENETLAEIHQMLEARLGSVLSVARNLFPNWDDTIEDNQRMLAALEARDSRALAAIASQRASHLAKVVREAFYSLETKGAKPASVPSVRR
ncbi:GntR family transcriptional regulator [Bradyrhizobium sp.]|uniref:GntR family transcriptional regulator n=1 Tax=Bradyrhizobium sp. TaxID=376 RepID=UPI0025C3D773|nr:GntR family transcriptional regulator [Bradyrhizobium sp.]